MFVAALQLLEQGPPAVYAWPLTYGAGIQYPAVSWLSWQFVCGDRPLLSIVAPLPPLSPDLIVGNDVVPWIMLPKKICRLAVVVLPGSKLGSIGWVGPVKKHRTMKSPPTVLACALP